MTDKKSYLQGKRSINNRLNAFLLRRYYKYLLIRDKLEPKWLIYIIPIITAVVSINVSLIIFVVIGKVYLWPKYVKIFVPFFSLLTYFILLWKSVPELFLSDNEIKAVEYKINHDLG